jgi:hypothetical protein
MAGEEEILKFTIDKSDADAKLADLEQRLENLKAKQAAGQDTSELEAQFAKEADGLERIAKREKEGAGATEDLVKQKEKLTAVISSLGGQFSGLAGNLGSVIELMLKGSHTAIGLGAALAAITLAISLYQKLKDSIKESVEEQQRLNEAVAEGNREAAERGATLAEQLLSRGGITRFEDASRMADALSKGYGFRPEQAQAAAALGTMAGVSVEDAAVLAVARIQGVQLATPEDAQRFLAQARPEVLDWYREQAEAFRTTEAAQAERLRAAVAAPTGGRRPAEEVLFDVLKGRGELPADVENVDQLRTYLQRARRIVQLETERSEQGMITGIYYEEGVPGTWKLRPEEIREARRLTWLLEQSAGGTGRLDRSWTPQAGGGAPLLVVQHNERIGTIIGNNGNKKTRPWKNPWDYVDSMAPGMSRAPLGP